MKHGAAILFLISLGSLNDAQALSWAEIENRALQANPEIQSWKSTAEALDYERKEAYSTYFPQFNLVADETRQDGKDAFATFDPLTNTIRLQSQKKYNVVQSYGLKSSWNIFKGFATEATVDYNSAELQAARNQLDLKSIELRYSLRTAYIQYLMAKRGSKTSQKIIDQQRRNRDLIRVKYETGLEAAWALEQANVALQLAQLQLESDNENLRQASERLNVLLDTTVEISDSEESLSIEPLPEFSAAALDSHPQLLYYQNQKGQAQAQRKLARSEFYPSIDAVFSWIHSQEKDDEGIEQNFFGLTLTWNIFDGLASRHRLKAAAAHEFAAELNERALRDQLRLDIQQQKRTYDLALRNVFLKKAELKAAVSRSDTVSNQYRNGLRKYQEWEAAELRLTDLERQMVAVEKEALMLRAAWEKTAGKKLGDL